MPCPPNSNSHSVRRRLTPHRAKNNTLANEKAVVYTVEYSRVMCFECGATAIHRR